MNIVWPGADKKSHDLFNAISVLVGADEKLIEFLFDPIRPRLRKRAGILRDDSWSFTEEEQLALRVALDLWSGSGHVQLWELIEAWSGEHWQRFSMAMSVLHLEVTSRPGNDGNQTSF